MTQSIGAGGRKAAAGRTLVLSGKGAPGGAVLAESLVAVEAVAEELRVLKRRVGGHEFKAPPAEVRLSGPRSRGGPSWTVQLRVPGFVTERDVKAAAAKVGHRRPLALRVQLFMPAPGTEDVHPGRDRRPVTIRQTREGAVAQHRARELR